MIELNRSRNNVVLSRRAVLEEERKEQRQQILDKLQPGDVVEGQISNIVDFGAFVDLDGMDGLIHISELSWSHVNHPSEVLEIGQDVQVKVLDIDRDRQRISLGLKQTQSDPWQQVIEKYHEDDVVERSRDQGGHARGRRRRPRDTSRSPAATAGLSAYTQPEGDALAIAVDVEHLDLHVLADLEPSDGWLTSTRELGDVDEAVHAVEVDECARSRRCWKSGPRRRRRAEACRGSAAAPPCALLRAHTCGARARRCCASG